MRIGTFMMMVIGDRIGIVVRGAVHQFFFHLIQ